MSAVGYPFTFASPAPLGHVVFLGIFLFVYLVLLVFTTVRLLQKWRHRMVSPRNLITLIPFQWLNFASCVLFSVSIILGKPQFCIAQDAMYLAIPVFAMHFNLNTPELVFQSDLNSLKVSRAQGGTKDRVFVIIKMFSLPFKLLYMVLVGAIQVGIYLALTMAIDLPGDCNRASQIAYTINMLGFILVLSYFLVRVSKVQDPYYMKLENNFSFMICIPQIFMMITYPVAPVMYGEWFDYRWVMIFYTPVAVIGNGLFPALLTFDWFRDRLDRFKGNQITTEHQQEVDTKGTIYALKQGVDVFQAVLNHPDLCEAFTQFTISEWSVENVLFYKAVDEYKRQAPESTPANLQILAQRIVQEYVAVGSALEINLDQKVRNQLLKAVKEAAAEDSFNHAQRCIYTLMEVDSFKKWQKTDGFRQALEQVVETRNSSSSKGQTRSQIHNPGSHAASSSHDLKIIESVEMV